MNVRIVNDPICQSRPNLLAAHQVVSMLAGVTVLPGLHQETSLVRIATEGASCRFTINNSNPTSLVGELLPAGSVLLLSSSEARAAKFFPVSGTVTLQIMQFATLA